MIENVYTTEEIDKFHKKYINVVAVAIGLILCGVIYEGFVEEMQLPARFEEDIFFFLLGFVGNYWNISWIAFPVGGLLCGIVSIILAKE